MPKKYKHLYLSVIRDLYDNSIVVFNTGTKQNINLVLSTIREAKKRKRSTQSCNSTVTKAFSTLRTRIIAKQNLGEGSMRNRDALMTILAWKAFFSTLKKKLTFRRKYATIEDVKTDLYRYIELFYNRNVCIVPWVI